MRRNLERLSGKYTPGTAAYNEWNETLIRVTEKLSANYNTSPDGFDNDTDDSGVRNDYYDEFYSYFQRILNNAKKRSNQNMLALGAMLNKSQDLMFSEASKLKEGFFYTAKVSKNILNATQDKFDVLGTSAVVGLGRELEDVYFSIMGLFGNHRVDPGDFSSSFLGLGVAVSKDLGQDFRVTAGLDGGSAKLDDGLSGSVATSKATFFFGGYLKLGQQVPLDLANFSWYGAYLYGLVQGAEICGISFQSVHSNRIRIGGQLTFDFDNFSPLVGAAVEHEFGATATERNSSGNDSSSLKGNRCILEAGATFGDHKHLRGQVNLEKYFGKDSGSGISVTISYLW